MSLRRLAIVISLVTGASVVSGPLRTEPLAKEDCDKLMAEKSELTGAGVRDQFDKGPEWAKANMSPEQLGRVKRFITVEEQLNFRCGLAKLRSTLPIAEEGGEQELDEKGNPIPPKPAGEAANAAAKGQATPKAKAPGKSIEGAAAAKVTAPPKTKAPAAKDAAASGTAVTKAAPAKAASSGSGTPSTAAKPQQKAKPKVDDSYKPPKSDPNANPFAGQAPAQKIQ